MDELEHGTQTKPTELFEKVLQRSQYIMVVPVVILLLAAVGTFVYGAVLFVDETRAIVQHPYPVSKNIGYFVLIVDVLLVGATLMIAAFGFYELFLSHRAGHNRGRVLPEWLVMDDLNDLKARVVSMVVLISAVTFLEILVDFGNSKNILYVGVGVAVLILALTFFSRFGAKGHG